jgi:HSP20 family protein
MKDVSPWHSVSDIAAEFMNMQREAGRVFDGSGGDAADANRASFWLPPVDVVERENDFLVKAEVPGVEKNDVKITVQNDVLTIKGERKKEHEKKGENYHRIERSYGTFQRSFTLPSSIVSDKIEATYDNGVLLVSLPKLEESKPKSIEVKVK